MNTQLNNKGFFLRLNSRGFSPAWCKKIELEFSKYQGMNMFVRGRTIPPNSTPPKKPVPYGSKISLTMVLDDTNDVWRSVLDPFDPVTRTRTLPASVVITQMRTIDEYRVVKRYGAEFDPRNAEYLIRFRPVGETS